MRKEPPATPTTSGAPHASTSARPESEPPWTTRRLLDWMRGYFVDRKIDSPRLVAEWLLAHVLGCQRLRLYMEADRPASPDELVRLRGLVKRIAAHEPVQYVLGEWDFYGRPFFVSPCTLIPRPCTESLVEQVIRWGRGRGVAKDGNEARPIGGIADLGTGTGCIGLTLALEWPAARLVATDIAPEVLELARRNAERHGVSERVEFRLGSLLEPLAGERFDIIASNPPYIPDDEWTAVAPNVRDYEPHRALRGGADGLAFIRPLLAVAAEVLTPRGLLAVEIPHAKRDAVLALAADAPGLMNARLEKDSEGLWRVLLAERTG